MRSFQYAVFALALLSSRAESQFRYDRTIFLHGFNDTRDRWLRGKHGYASIAPTDTLATLVDLGQYYYLTPQLSGTESVATQAAETRNLINTRTGRDVLVGLSAGGLVARKAYRIDSTKIAGIITVATPHRGTLLANHAHLIYPFFTKVIDRLNVGLSGLGGHAVLDIRDFINFGVVPTRAEAQRLAGIPSPALNDLKVGSAQVAELGTTGELVPRANVYASTSLRHAVLRVASSGRYEDDYYDNIVRWYNYAKSALKVCKQVGRVLIVGLFTESGCDKAEQTMVAIDDTWLIYVNGVDTSYVGPYQVRQIKRDPFDGVVSNWRSQYPGGGFNFPVIGANHMSIQYDRDGIAQIKNAMRALGMFAR